MPMLTHVEGSPNGLASASATIARRYIDGYVRAHPDTEVRTLRVFDDDALPGFGAVEAATKLATVVGLPFDAEAQASWDRVGAFVRWFDETDVIVLSSPIWNFHVPWRLKLFFDVIIQPGISFRFDEHFQAVGALRDRPVRMFLTRSSTGSGHPDDFQLPWLRRVWSVMGLHDVDAAVTGTMPMPGESPEAIVATAAQAAYDAGAAA